MNNIHIELNDYKKFLSTIKDRSIDFICIDPPYGKTQGMILKVKLKKLIEI